MVNKLAVLSAYIRRRARGSTAMGPASLRAVAPLCAAAVRYSTVCTICTICTDRKVCTVYTICRACTDRTVEYVQIVWYVRT